MIRFDSKPFDLNDEQIQWIKSTFNSMSEDEKIGQMFCPLVFTRDERELKNLVEKYHVGAVVGCAGQGNEVRKVNAVLQKHTAIPLLIASDLESGGQGATSDGTHFGSEMLVAATGNDERAYELGKVSCAEAASVGVNWAFAPVVDLDMNYHNPIMNIRTFGDDPDAVIQMGKEYLRAAGEEGVATACKHFPGDGMDERDQHLLTSVNSCSVDEWDRTYGRIYEEMIAAGTKTIMVGHIALPAYEEYFDKCEIDHIIPATLSSNLMQKLLREKLGFNGLITSDATPMTGFGSALDRETAVPLSIENGCDIFLFSRDLEEDIGFMKQGLKNGILSAGRLEEAVLRILALKASMNLPEKQKSGALVPEGNALEVLNCSRFDAWAKACSDEGVTLVKDTQQLLPLNPIKHKRVLLELIGGYESDDRVCKCFSELLTKEGFEVTIYPQEGFKSMDNSVASLKGKYDLIMYIANTEAPANKTTARLNWQTMFGMGINVPWMVHELPVILISVGNPYCLLDAPMIKTCINGYCNSKYVINAVMEKIMGRSSFRGRSPIDPFCGKIDTRF